MMDVKAYVDPKSQDILLTDVKKEDLPVISQQMGKVYLYDSDEDQLDFIQGIIYGDYQRSFVVLPCKL